MTIIKKLNQLAHQPYFKLLIWSFVSLGFLFQSANAADTNDSLQLHSQFEGTGMTYAFAGNSEIVYNTNLNVLGVCSKNNGAATSSGLLNPDGTSLTLASDATIQAVYIQWYALTYNADPDGSNLNNLNPLVNSINLTLPDGSVNTVTGSKSYEKNASFNGYLQRYQGYLADITSLVKAMPLTDADGTYTVNLAGQNDAVLPQFINACAYREENARAWQMTVIYSSPTTITDTRKVYFHDGIQLLLSQTGVITPVTGYEVPSSGSTTGKLSVMTLQGDSAIFGETMTTSDALFPNMPGDFANSAGITSAKGVDAVTGGQFGGWDIDTLTGNFTAGSTSMNLVSGSVGDVFLITGAVLEIPSVPAVNPLACTTTPNLVFILDDSDSTSDLERSEMSTSIQKIIDGVEAVYPNTRVGIVQYGQEFGPDPQAADYVVTLPYSNNPTVSITHVPNSRFSADHLPGSVNKMIRDGIFDSAGVLKNPDMFFIFTDARKMDTGGCCSIIENGGPYASPDAAAGFGEYSKLAQLSSSGTVSLYQVEHSPLEASPEVAQGNGIYRGGASSFTVSQADIDAFIANISANICPSNKPTTPVELTCPVGYQQETWPASAPNWTEFDSSNNLLKLTASTNFTNTTHPGIGGIRTSSSFSEVSETLSISAIDTSVLDIKKLRILVYDLDSETANDQDYAYITFDGVNMVANSMGSNVEPHPTISNAYQAILNSGGGSGADNNYHASFIVEGIADGSTISMTSGYTGTDSESFVGYQACVKVSSPPIVYTPNTCGDPGFLETFGSGVDRVSLPASARTNYDYDEGPADTNNGAVVMDNQYTVLDKSSIASAGDWWIIDDDHTGDANGRMLMVNAKYFAGEFYRQSITGLIVGTEYSFAAHIANAEGDAEVRIPVNVKFSIESDGTEIAFTETGNILQDPGRDELAWSKHELTFTATSTDVDIVLVNNISGGMGNDLVIDDISISEVCSVCTTLTGEVTEIALPILAQLKTTDKLFVPSKDISTSEGHLKAYSIDSNGVPFTSASWDATNVMSGRISKLYSSDASGNKILFNSLDTAAFASTSAATIKAATIAANLGGVSKGNNLDILSNDINTSLYLSDTTYRSYYSTSVSSRSKRVLMSSDDGFLYAFDSSSGALVWAWMPRSLVSELASSASFQSKHLMSGSVDILDLPDSLGSYSTYVVGSYKNGLGRYVLKLAGNGDLSQVIWDDDQSADFTESPNNGAMEFFRDGSGLVYASYVLTDSTLISNVRIRSLVDSSKNDSIALTYRASSTPFMMQDFGRSNAPAKKTLYIGTSLGNIHAAEVLDNSGNFNNVASIQLSLEGSSVTTMDNIGTDAILYIDASVSAKDNKYYLSSQTATRLTIHRYKSSDSSWNKTWTSYSSGAGSWDDAGLYSADNSGVPADQGGFAIIPPSGIQSLPVDATITDKAIIAGDTVILPLSVVDGLAATCYGKAYYYIYSLSDGKFPMGKVVMTDNTPVITNIALGYGDAKQVSVTNLAGTNKLIAYGIADKKVDLTSGIATTFVIKDPITGGIRGWKEIGR